MENNIKQEHGKKKKNWFLRHKIITAILILIILGAIGSGASNSSSTSQSDTMPAASDNQAAASADEKPMVSTSIVEAQAFVEEYDKNKLSADDKYAGTTVQLTAFIKNISEDILGDYYLSLNPSDDQYYYGTSIKCTFKDKSALTSLENGQSVTVSGKVAEMSLGIIPLNDCSLVK